MSTRTGRGVAVLAIGLGLVAPTCAAGQSAMAATPEGPAFTIVGTIHAAPAGGFPAAACGSAAATLVPGVIRCLAIRIDNHLDVPITVRSVTVSLDPAHPPPPAGCGAGELVLPHLSGLLSVPARGSASSAALPISLRDTPSNQDACQHALLHFAYSGTAGPAASPPQPSGGGLAFTGSDAVPVAALGVVLLALGLLLAVLGHRARPGREGAS